jgi:hypothetical protein
MMPIEQAIAFAKAREAAYSHDLSTMRARYEEAMAIRMELENIHARSKKCHPKSTEVGENP